LSKRLPQATYRSLAAFLDAQDVVSVRRTIECPPSVDPGSWGRLRASLTTLGLIGKTAAGSYRALKPLADYVADPTPVLYLLIARCGPAVIEATLNGTLTGYAEPTLRNFNALVRLAARAEAGETPARRRRKSLSPTSSQEPGGEPSDLLRGAINAEIQEYLRWTSDLRKANDLAGARKAHQILESLYTRLEHL
jgi:hypothetical protein